MDTVAYKRRIDGIIERIEKARLRVSAHHIVKIVAISKYVDSEAIRALYEIGQRAFGENKVQDLRRKSAELEELPLEWHFVGSLQKNKINNLLDCNPFLMHSIDSLDLAEAIDKKARAKGIVLNALLQINSAKEESKHGFMPEEAYDRYMQIQERCANIDLKGVMSIGAHTDDTALVKKSFETTYSIYEKLPNATICSMGMSSDFELAIECGSNMLRLGSIMFNNRYEEGE